ncbi:MAG TPA: late competence development ComFB family protein [Gammaproteobacteria bacterium]|nr:late competence development ComFB family protein [Gammaproteobacteria bacterium]
MDFSSIHNYYEHLVTDYIMTQVTPRMPDKSADYFLDVACYALSKLPARYMRHEIDMAFYMSIEERLRMVDDVKKQVEAAVTFIDKNFNKDNRYGDNA